MASGHYEGTQGAYYDGTMDEVEISTIARGLQLINDLGIAEIWERTGRRRSEIRGYEFYRVASARV